MSNHRIRVSVSGAIVRDGKVLLVAYNDDQAGFHYNFPGGGVEQGESLVEALRREMWEEAAAIVEVGPLIHVWEYIPEKLSGQGIDPQHTLGPIFRCTLAAGSEPRQPDNPDATQVGVHWIALTKLREAPLLPRPSPTLIAALQMPDDNFAAHCDVITDPERG